MTLPVVLELSQRHLSAVTHSKKYELNCPPIYPYEEMLQAPSISLTLSLVNSFVKLWRGRRYDDAVESFTVSVFR